MKQMDAFEAQKVFEGFKDLESLLFFVFSLMKLFHGLCLDRLSFLMKSLASESLP
jgi:hypothetical protein